jgi:charged multivesicular body protein 3
MKVKRSLKEAAKKGDKTVCTMLAKEIVRSRKAKDRLHTSKAQMNSVVMQLQQQAGIQLYIILAMQAIYSG